MTERNFVTVIPGFYRTRNGDLAEVVKILDARCAEKYPVRGMIGYDCDTWTVAGDNLDDRATSRDDLIKFLGTENPREKRMLTNTISLWVNVYPRYTSPTFATEAYANDGAAPNRIACVELTGEYQVEEEV